MTLAAGPANRFGSAIMLECEAPNTATVAPSNGCSANLAGSSATSIGISFSHGYASFLGADPTAKITFLEVISPSSVCTSHRPPCSARPVARVRSALT
ncbi:Uncharacterised protein [Mycobacteroides abscessus subsp. abscessus]|nr:Uncharacterised protein [Mycobacteroides abscessus subsp. abscessus]